MIYFGNQLNKISYNLNMLLNQKQIIDFDIFFKQISNIYFNINNCQIIPYPSILHQLKTSNYFTISNNLKEIQYPILLGNIDKAKLYNRIEKFYYQLELDLILIFKEDEKFYYCFDSDIAPYLKLPKKLIEKNIKEKIIISIKTKIINFDRKKLLEENISNIYSKNLIGSNAYLSVSNFIKKEKLSSKNRLTLYHSIKELTILNYKMINFLKNNKKLIQFFKNESNLFVKIIYNLSNKDKENDLIDFFFQLYTNRKELEKYVTKYPPKSTYS